MRTKDKIKKASLELFNENTTTIITTNHIAKKAKISPGNLYYHYKNKEEIILDIYKDLTKDFLNLNGFNKIEENVNPFEEMNSIFNLYEKIFFKYRFLLRDSVVLFSLYPNLKNLFIYNQEIRISQIKKLLEYLINNKLIKINKNLIEKKAKLHWFLITYWQVFISTNEEINVDIIKEQRDIFFEFMIIPFLTKKGKELFYFTKNT